MPALSRMVMRAAMRTSARLGIPAAVNIPPGLVGDWLTVELARAMKDTGATPDSVIVELTEESLLRDAAGASRSLSQLRDTGVRVVLDDFGTGWSGLSTMRAVPLDGLKLDRSFVSGMVTDPWMASIVRHVTELSQDMGLTVTLEGIETDEVLLAASATGASLGQGFLIARPMPPEDLDAWLTRHRSRPAIPTTLSSRVASRS